MGRVFALRATHIPHVRLAEEHPLVRQVAEVVKEYNEVLDEYGFGSYDEDTCGLARRLGIAEAACEGYDRGLSEAIQRLLPWIVARRLAELGYRVYSVRGVPFVEIRDGLLVGIDWGLFAEEHLRLRLLFATGPSTRSLLRILPTLYARLVEALGEDYPYDACHEILLDADTGRLVLRCVRDPLCLEECIDEPVEVELGALHPS